jgi:hypothetical protein
VDATTRAITATAMDGDGRRMEGRRMGLDPSSTRPSGIDGSDGIRRDLAHGLLRVPPIDLSRDRLGGAGRVEGMGMGKKIAALGIAKKVYDEARKPHNQAKIKAAVQKVQERRSGKRY